MGDFEMNLEDSMRETFNEISEEPVEESEEFEEETVEQSGRARDEKGRFVAQQRDDAGQEDRETEAVAEVEEEVFDEPQGIVVDESQQISEPQDIDPSIINPPPTLTAAAKADWKNWPESARREFVKREEDARRGVEALKGDLSQKAEFGEKMNSVVTPYMPFIQAEGGTPESAVAEMLNSAYILRQGPMQQKVELTLQLAQEFGFLNEMVAMLQGNGQNIPAPQYDPRVDMLERKIAEDERRRQEESQSSAQQQVTEFASATNEHGDLLYPYFENVREDMYTILSGGRADSLEAAYEAAIWMNPETRSILEREHTSQLEVERQEKAKERAKKAERANKVNLPKRGHHESRGQAPTGSIEDTMRETMEKLSAR